VPGNAPTPVPGKTCHTGTRSGLRTAAHMIAPRCTEPVSLVHGCTCACRALHERCRYPLWW
jgi:hypothetical protein